MSKKSIVDIIESNKKTLRAEYQRGYIAGFAEGKKRSTEEFIEDLKPYGNNVKSLRVKWEAKKNE